MRPYESNRLVWGAAIFPLGGGEAFAHVTGYDRDEVLAAVHEIIEHEKEYPVHTRGAYEVRLGDMLAPSETADYAELEREGIVLL